MAVALASELAMPGQPYMTIPEASELSGVKKQGVYKAVYRGRLHPVHLKGMPYQVVFRSEVLAWRRRLAWRPSPQEMEALLASGYAAEDFTPATPGELAEMSQGASSPGGAPEASGAFVRSSDILAALEQYMRDGQALTASVAPVVGSATESAMRGWLAATAGTDASSAPPDVADVAARVTESAIRPIAETIRANVAPLTEALAQAMKPHPTPPTEDLVARQMGVLRVELAQLLNRIMDVLRPIVERLASGRHVTPEDIKPFMELVGELAMSLAGSPFYELAPRDAPALMPGILTQTLADGASQNASPTPGATSGEK